MPTKDFLTDEEMMALGGNDLPDFIPDEELSSYMDGGPPAHDFSGVSLTPIPESLLNPPAKKPTFFSGIKRAAGERRAQQEDALGRSIEGEQSLGEGLLQAAGAGAGFIGDVGFEALKGVTPDAIEAPVARFVGGAARKAIEATPEGVKRTIEAHPRAVRNVSAVTNLALLAPGVGGTVKAVETVAKGAKKGTQAVKRAAEIMDVPKEAPRVPKTTIPVPGALTKKASKDVAKREAAILTIQNNYAPTRKAMMFSKDALSESRRRVASTDVLVGSADDTGVIRTKQPGGAVEQYKAQTIDHSEGVVRTLLDKEGRSVAPEILRAELRRQVMRSGLEGKALRNALNNIDGEVDGLIIRANPDGKIPLVAVHDAKISTTGGINYMTEPFVKAERKAVARAYKETVEKESAINVGEINAELQKYLKDVELLESLDGKRVPGGKLGKYFASVTGTVAGGAVGGAIGGFAGMAAGSVVGAEVASKIKGRGFTKAFGKSQGLQAPESEILKKAVDKSKEPRLALPPGNPKGPRSSTTNTKPIITPAPFQAEARAKIVNREKAPELTEDDLPVEPYILPGDMPVIDAGPAPKRKSPLLPTAKNEPPKVYGPEAKKKAKPASKAKSKRGVTKPEVMAGGAAATGAAAYELNERKHGRKSKLGAFAAVGATALAARANPGVTTKLLEKLGERKTVSKQFILDLTNGGDLKQAERDLIRETLKGEGGQVNVPAFKEKVRDQLLPLKVGVDNKGTGEAQFENITLPDDIRGPVSDYYEKVYESPVKNSAGDVHGFPTENYFAHSRIEDLPQNEITGFDDELGLAFTKDGKQLPIDQAGGSTRRVIEIQSDLFQKGRLEREKFSLDGNSEVLEELKDEPMGKVLIAKREKELAKLEPYRNTWHERVIREEVKKAAQDGKTKLQFPTGETAMKIEGLGSSSTFGHAGPGYIGGRDVAPSELKVGLQIVDDPGNEWIITDVLGDGKFKAIQKREFVHFYKKPDSNWNTHVKATQDEQIDFMDGANVETFDISGKIDTNNPIYKYYEKDVGKYLINRYGAKRVTDPQGVEWYQVDVDPSKAKAPVEAFGAGAVGAGAAVEERKKRKNALLPRRGG
jgi:hypothetical protein